MKKNWIFTTLLAFAVFVLCFTLFPTEAKAATDGYLTYEIVDGGAVITDCDESVTGEITIPDTLGGYPVTTIGEFAFAHLTNPLSVNTGNSVTIISDAAFLGCTGLEHITLGDGVSSIGSLAFEACENLQNFAVSANNPNYSCINGVLYNKNQTVLFCAPKTLSGEFTVPAGVLTVGEYAFDGCMDLTGLVIGDNVTTISARAFNNCMNLKTVELGNRVETVGEYAFMNCNRMNKIAIPVITTQIGDCAFGRCTALTDVYYAGTPTQWDAIIIGGNNDPLDSVTIHYESNSAVMYDPEYLTYEIVDGEAIITDCDETASGSITIPDTLGGYPVKAIGSDAFFCCSGLTEVVLPEGIVTIGDAAFYSCDNLKKINIPTTVNDIGNTAFAWCSSLEEIQIPDGVAALGNSAFGYCDSITEVYLPASVVMLGSSPFGGCPNLAEISAAKDNPYFCSGEFGILLNKDKTELIQVPGGLGGGYTVPSGVTTICKSAFRLCSNLEKVTIPTGVTTIESQAFNSTGITSITIPVTVTNIGVGALGECSNLTDIYYGGTEEQWAQINIGEENSSLTAATIHFSGIEEIPTEPADPWYLTYEVFNNQAKITDCDESVSGNIQLPGTLGGYPVTAIGYDAFWGCTDITGITIPDSVTSIGGSAFYSCVSLESIIIPDGITTISGSMFGWCESLVSVTIPDSVTSIQAGAFYHCDSLTSIHIPERVTEIGVNAFGWCTSLNEINIPDGVTEIKDNTFYQCEALTQITLPAGITDIGEWAFSYSGLESISIPSGVTKISYNAFSYCQNLVRVDLPSGVTCIDNNAFENCPALRDITIPANVTYIGDGAFFNCYSLTDVTIPAGVTSIEYSTFCGCGFTSIVIPDSITYIGEYGLGNCENLTKVTFLGDAPTISDNAFFCDLTTIIYPADASGWDAIIGNQYAGELTWYCNRPLEITTQPKTAKVKAGATAKFTVKAIGMGLKYQWQSSTNGKTWKNCSSSSATKATFSFTAKTSHSSNYYRCKVTDYEGNVLYTNAVRLYVLGITTQPKTQKVEAGEKATFTVAASGAGKTYQWQSSTDGKTWKNCSSSSATKATFAFTSKTSHNGNYYRCVVKDNAGNTVYTDAVRLYVLGITTQPKTQKVKTGTTVKFTVKATGTGLKYQWQSSADGKTWKNCSSTSATKVTFSFAGKTSHNGNYYRCKVTDSAGNVVYTSTVRLYVLGITEQPVSKTVTKGKTAKFTVEATGTGLKYQWQCSTDGGKTWKNCSSTSAKKATFTFTSRTTHNGNYYRCRVTDSAGNVIYTGKVKLTVKK